MIFGIIFINLALIFYTTAIWTERKIKKIKKWILFIFSLGFLSDLIGTSIMFVNATERFSYNIHTISGYSALLIMLLHLIWAILSFLKSERYEKYFTKFSIIAWFIWLLAFVTGASGNIF